jgi:hypothetical protein
MIFIDDIYSQQYYSIISGAKSRAQTRKAAQELFPETVIERHHIIPRCFFMKKENKNNPGWLDGNPDGRNNLVFLTACEHYRCHFLLADMILIESIYNAKAHRNLVCAISHMSFGKCFQEKYEVTEEEYVKAKEYFSSIRKGITLSPETCARMSAASKGKKKATRSDEHCANLSIAQKGKKRGPYSAEHRANISKGQLGNKRNPHTEETRAKMRTSNKGRIVTPEIIEKRKITRKKNKEIIEAEILAGT